MRSRPRILLDVVAAALRAMSTRASDDGLYEEFVEELNEQGVYDTFVITDDWLEAKLQGQPCPACGDREGMECPVCGFAPEQLPPPGWYEDPQQDGFRRYWTGQAWHGGPVEMNEDDAVEVGGTYEPTNLYD